MAERTGKCINFGLCSKADSREIVPVAGGGDFSCPECGKPLTEAAGGGGGARAASGGGGGKKAIAIGALGLALIAGTAYKFLSAPDKKDDTPNQGPNVAVQDPNAVVPPGPSGPVVPPNPNAPGLPPDQTAPVIPRQPIPQPRIPKQRPPVSAPEEVAEEPVTHHDGGTMVARLLSAINTRTASQGDTFTAKLEDGPYKGGILSGSIKKLKKSRKSCELELAFDKLNGKPIPVGLDLVDITNAHGVKGVDDENNKIVGKSSKKKVALVTAAGATLGGVIGALKGGKKGAVIGAGAGGAAGFVLSMTVMSRAQDVDLQPGSHLTLKSTGR